MPIKIYATTNTHSCSFYVALVSVAPDLFLSSQDFDQLTPVANNEVK